MITDTQRLARSLRIAALRQLRREDEITALPPLRDLDIAPLTETERAEQRGFVHGVLLTLEALRSSQSR